MAARPSRKLSLSECIAQLADDQNIGVPPDDALIRILEHFDAVASRSFAALQAISAVANACASDCRPAYRRHARTAKAKEPARRAARWRPRPLGFLGDQQRPASMLESG